MSIYSKSYNLQKLKELWDSGKILCEEIYNDGLLIFVYKIGDLQRVDKNITTIKEILDTDITLSKSHHIQKQDFRSLEDLDKYMSKELKTDIFDNNEVKNNTYPTNNKINHKKCKWDAYTSKIVDTDDGQYLYLLRMGKRVDENIGVFSTSYNEVYYCCFYLLFRSAENIKILKNQGIEE